MKTIYEKTYANEQLATAAAIKEFGESWSANHLTVKVGTRWGVAKAVESAKTGKRVSKKEPKPINTDKLTRKQFDAIAASGKCPCCEAAEDAIYLGSAPEGVVLDEDRTIGCHQCGWEFSFPAPKKMAEALAQARRGYVKTLSYAGTMSADNNDPVAEALRGLNPAQVCAVADAVAGAKKGTHIARYGNLNVGQQRMNAGNVVRAAHKKGKVTDAELTAIVAKVAPAKQAA